MEHTDSGVLGVTTKHIYFKGDEKSFRVRLEKIVSFEPYQDGLGIMRDTARAKPETFTMDPVDAWFSINLIEALLDIDDLKPPRPGRADAGRYRRRERPMMTTRTTRACSSPARARRRRSPRRAACASRMGLRAAGGGGPRLL